MRIEKVFQRFVGWRGNSEMMEFLNGCGHTFFAAHGILLNPEHFGPEGNLYWRLCGFVGEGKEQFNFLVLTDGQVGVEEHAIYAYIPRFATDLETRVRDFQRNRDLQRKTMGNTTF